MWAATGVVGCLQTLQDPSCKGKRSCMEPRERQGQRTAEDGDLSLLRLGRKPAAEVFVGLRVYRMT